MPPEAAGDDVVIVGAGIVGLATARRILQLAPGTRLRVIEKDPAVGRQQTGHNSGVIHAGIYYAPGSMKARLCRDGKAQLERYCEDRGIEVVRCGKLVVASGDQDLAGLAQIQARAEANGAPVELVGPERLAELEPHAVGVRALWSPTTAIVDFGQVAAAMAADVQALGGRVDTGTALTGITRTGGRLVLRAGDREIVTRALITCAGLHSDRVARLTGDAGPERIVPFRGDYYTFTKPASTLVRGLIYPVPDPSFPFLGVHLTKRVDGAVWAGPNAVLAFAREGYRRRDVNAGDLADVLRTPGFRRLARRYWRTGLGEMWRDWSKGAFLREIQRFVPAVRASDLVFGPSGVRAQAIDPDGSLVDDFRFGGSTADVLHVRNAPSPAATASLAIADELAARAAAQFGLDVRG
jgi:L-2-hydroxyglutarate oxidase LhgO